MSKAVKIAPDWQLHLQAEFDQPYFETLTEFVRDEYSKYTVYPPGPEIFRAFDTCSFDAVRIVVVGQDPYHGQGQANGLCFSVRKGVTLPPSLVNIFKEVAEDTGKPISRDGDLERWSRQGVLLLNATLTVRASSPGSHQNKGWETFTDAVIRLLSNEKTGLVFLLWGAYAQRKGLIIDRSKHFVVESAHPSPFSAHKGFFGSRPFSKINQWLRERGEAEIEW
ncbi:MAG: uracil-DNA glycosylase [Bacteroidetes bacterium]|nr:uracil-DNA glycosylase [Bacteroidota bacterium]